MSKLRALFRTRRGGILERRGGLGFCLVEHSGFGGEYSAVNAVFHQWRIEIEDKSDGLLRCSEVGIELAFVDEQDFFDRFYLDDDLVFYK